MSRTWRNLRGSPYLYFKRPRTFNEIRQLSGLKNDYQDLGSAEPRLGWTLSKQNRLFGRYIPTAWDDVVISGYRERRYRS